MSRCSIEVRVSLPFGLAFYSNFDISLTVSRKLEETAAVDDFRVEIRDF